jgi:hypothetical protein
MKKRFCDICNIELTDDNPGAETMDGMDYCDEHRPYPNMDNYYERPKMKVRRFGIPPGVVGSSKGPGSGAGQIAYERIDVAKEHRLLGAKWESDGTFERHPGMRAQWEAKGRQIASKPNKVVDMEERMRARDDVKYEVPSPQVNIGDDVQIPGVD